MHLTYALVLFVVLLGGFMRGVTGFGGSMVMAVPLSLILGPVPTVIIALTLEATAAFVMFPKALPIVDVRRLVYLTLPACLTVPFGGYLLLTLDPFVARKIISMVVVVFSLLLMTGFRYTGRPQPKTMIALGSLVGLLLGATSMGAPPVILYLLSSTDPHRVTRANLTVFVTAISLIGLIMLAIAGALTWHLMVLALLLAGPFVLATWAGGLLFEKVRETSVRRLSLATMLTIGLLGLVVF